ncbi:UNVERIFIED_CONTAM: hypothetical protein FKN15_056887 [Acipenser sinensis]
MRSCVTSLGSARCNLQILHSAPLRSCSGTLAEAVNQRDDAEIMSDLQIVIQKATKTNAASLKSPSSHSVQHICEHGNEWSLELNVERVSVGYKT